MPAAHVFKQQSQGTWRGTPTRCLVPRGDSPEAWSYSRGHPKSGPHATVSTQVTGEGQRHRPVTKMQSLLRNKWGLMKNTEK